jgi:enoyl-CoA hydratase/carnithine racemase
MSYEYMVENDIVIFKFKNGKTNPISTETLQGLAEVVERVNQEEQLKGIIITGMAEAMVLSIGMKIASALSVSVAVAC